EALYNMLGEKNVRTRYGAFRALTVMQPDDPRVAGEKLGERPNGKFYYHVLNVPGAPLIHVTRSHRRAIVLFGTEQPLKLPLVLDAGPRILVNGMHGDQITVSRFGAN